MCLTCRIIKGEYVPPGGIIYEDIHVILHQCIDVAIPGYLILSPKQHAEHYAEVSDGAVFQMASVSKVVADILSTMPEIGKIYITCFGELASHFHFHIFPRYDWLVAEGKTDVITMGQIDGAKLFSWARQQYKTLPEDLPHIVFKTVDELRQQLFVRISQ